MGPRLRGIAPAPLARPSGKLVPALPDGGVTHPAH